jgi:hypothetical protein
MWLSALSLSRGEIMVQRVAVAVLCDKHLKQGEEVEATWSEVVSIGRTTRRVELCEECSVAEGLDSLESWLREYGASANASRPAKTPTPRTASTTPAPANGKEQKMCGECGEGPFRGKQGLSMHNRRAHLGSAHDTQKVA